MATQNNYKNSAKNHNDNKNKLKPHILELQSIPTTIQPKELYQVQKEEACRCRHLERWLPHILDLSMVRKEGGGVVILNPIHALHLESLLVRQEDNNEEEEELLLHFGDEQARADLFWNSHDSGMNNFRCRPVNDGHYYSKRLKIERGTDDSFTTTHSVNNNNNHAKPSADVTKSSSANIVPRTTPSQAATAITTKPVPVPSGATSQTTAAATPVLPVPSGVPTEDEKNKTTTSQQQQDELSDDRYQQLRRAEGQVMLQQNKTFAKRAVRKNHHHHFNNKKQQHPSSSSSPKKMSAAVLDPYMVADNDFRREEIRRAHEKVEGWMFQFRSCRNEYWDRVKEKASPKQPLLFGAIPDDERDRVVRRFTCSLCPKSSSLLFDEDAFMKCLDCGYVACAPPSLGGNNHMRMHMLTSNKCNLAVTCGKRNSVYCFACCGDIIYHDVFDLERERIDLHHTVPQNWYWAEHSILRSFDPFQFVSTHNDDVGLVWRGLVATYPSTVPRQHLAAARMVRQRQQLIKAPLSKSSSSAEVLAASPVGLYNLGNMCFMNGILQCLIHCPPLQQYFLMRAQHDFRTCRYFRNSGRDCLACSMDLLFLEYYGSTMGQNLVDQLLLKPYNSSKPNEKGTPLIPSELLTEAWQQKEMDHLKGYEQRDAHEFLQAFLDIVGKHCQRYQTTIAKNLALATTDKDDDDDDDTAAKKTSSAMDIVKQLFEGTLRSVSICEVCGCKRSLQEPFLNVSLPLSQPEKATGRNKQKSKMNIRHCLKQFTAPESLTDTIDCPSCKRKTRTTKQQTFSRLPKILCLHLKRFDASKNQKITDFVSFPSKGLDMGSLLPHWCEMYGGYDDDMKNNTSTTTTNRDEDDDTSDDDSSTTTSSYYPRVLYDLYGTVNHTGTLHQGHYISHVLVKNQWYYCNDAHVSTSREEEVLKADGAYMLFYIRRNMNKV